MNDKFQNACNRITQKTPPIWFMRQAGRYHSHYQKLKEKYTFDQLAKNAELAAEVAWGPINEFDYDVSILFSDIVYPYQGLGVDVDFVPGPVMSEKISPANFEKYRDIDRAAEFMQFQADAVRATRERLSNDKSLIGFVGGPWTVAKYGIDPNANIDFKMQYLETVLIPLLKKNIQLQLDAGAEKVLIIDSQLESMNTDFLTNEYSAMLDTLVSNDTAYYIRNVDTDVAVDIAKKPWGGVGVDSSIDITKMLDKTETGFVQGNFNEIFMLLPEAEFKDRLKQFVDTMKETDTTGWVCGLGHGINKDTDERRVHTFIETVRTEFA